jgi:deazaflavin-dependent oxidoreductase (nitroreductase family)
MTTTLSPATRYVQPGKLDRFTNRIARRLVRLGVNVWGARELRVVGRKSGQVRTTVVNLLELDGRRYLVSPRGETEWVRNLRAAALHGELRNGRQVRQFDAVEVADADKTAVLRSYLDRWAFEVGKLFEGITAESGPAELAAVAADFPVFEVV